MSDHASFRIEEILPTLGARLIHGNPENKFSNFCIDSRYVDHETVFIPLMGQNRDGHQYIIDSITKGAAGVLVRAGHFQIHEIVSWLQEKEHRGFKGYQNVCVIEVRHTLVALQKLSEWFRRQFDVELIGITGSVGKTGTKEILIQLLSQKFLTVGTEKNFNNEIGVPLALGKINSRTKKVVIEMAMRARGEVSLLSRIAQPDAAVITNTAGSHVGRLGSFAEVYRAKAEVVDGLKAGGRVYLNRRDDNVVATMKEINKRRKSEDDLDFRLFDASAVFRRCGVRPFSTFCWRNGTEEEIPPSDVWVEDVKLKGLAGSSFFLCSNDERVGVNLNLLGCGAIENLACAAVIALDQGMSLAEIAESCPELMPAPQRLNLFELRKNLFLVDDCYNSSPASAQDSLELMLSIDPKYKKILVIGDMLELGKYETLLHRQYALITLNLPFDTVFAVGPRMNAVNEVEGNDATELFYIDGSSGYQTTYGYDDNRYGSSFGPPRHHQRMHHAVILDDMAASKLSALLINQLNQIGDQPAVVLVKGSRALHLERVVNDLLSGTTY